MLKLGTTAVFHLQEAASFDLRGDVLCFLSESGFVIRCDGHVAIGRGKAARATFTTVSRHLLSIQRVFIDAAEMRYKTASVGIPSATGALLR